MNSANRDILLLSKKRSGDKKEMELEVEKLHRLLFYVESMENFCIVNEIIDVNNYKIIRKPTKIEKIVRQTKLKPFVFINNKN